MIGIVGGGFAGLAAAHRLRRRGHEVRVFEAADDLGGLASTYATAGDPIERFYHHLSTTERTIIELAEELGIGDAIEWHYKSDGFYVDGVVHPMDTIWEIAAYPYLSLYDKFRLGLLTLEVDFERGVPRRDAYGDLADYEDVPIREFLEDRTTERVYRRFWEPLLEAKFGSRREEISAAWLLGRIRFRGDRDLLRGERLGYCVGSFGQLTEALVDSVGHEHVETGARVVGIGGSNGAVESIDVETADGVETHDVEAVVVATMPDVLEDLTGFSCGIDFQGTVCAVVTMAEPLTETYWLNFIDEAPFGVLIEHTNFVPPERYGGEHLCYLASYVQDPTEALWGMTDDEVREHWLDGLVRLFPSFDAGDVEGFRVARSPRTAPIYECGYLGEVVPYDLGKAVADGIYYAGMASRAQYPERSLNGAVEAGFACAAHIDGRPGPNA